MSQSYDSATIVVLDIGKNTCLGEEKQESFFETGKKCAARIIERNILMQGNLLIGLVVMGANKSQNSLAELCPGAFKYIKVQSELQSPTWQMIRNLPQETTERKGDWFEALIVAAHLYKENHMKIKGAKKIVLITNFQSPANIGKNFEEVVDGFQSEEYEVFVIGPDLETQDSKDVDAIKQLIKETGGETATFEEAMSSWLFHKKKSTKASLNHFSMLIGPHINIPVNQIIKVKDEPILRGHWQKTIKNLATGQASTTEAVVVEKNIVNTEDQSTVTHDETTSGYLFGQKVIPFSQSLPDLNTSLCYKGTFKCILVYGFTKKDNLDWQSFNCECMYYLTGKNSSQVFLDCLAHCMLEMDLVALVREQYHKRYAPKMKALTPFIDSNGRIRLSCIAVCFKEEIKHMAFPSAELKKYECNKEQVDAFKDLIKAMDLTNAYDDSFNDSEAFPIAETVSPSLQYILDCMAYRALNPDKPLPQPRDEIMTLFKVPPLVEKRSREPLEKLMKLLSLKKVEKKVSNRRKGRLPANDVAVPAASSSDKDLDIPKIKIPLLNNNEDDIESIGTIQPSKDFQLLLTKGKSLAELAPEMTDLIESLINTNIVADYTKVLDAMKTFRQECVKNGPAHYNDWLQKFKRILLERKRDLVINIINDNNLNFILRTENNDSVFTEESIHEDSQMYDNDTVPNSTELSIQTDVNDMFDDM